MHRQCALVFLERKLTPGGLSHVAFHQLFTTRKLRGSDEADSLPRLFASLSNLFVQSHKKGLATEKFKILVVEWKCYYCIAVQFLNGQFLQIIGFHWNCIAWVRPGPAFVAQVLHEQPHRFGVLHRTHDSVPWYQVWLFLCEGLLSDICGTIANQCKWAFSIV